ncbi:MAG: serine hydrolase [Chloroflexi bacterium]|nr:serine hydrolase [Chloroflexota bacterium]
MVSKKPTRSMLGLALPAALTGLLLTQAWPANVAPEAAPQAQVLVASNGEISPPDTPQDVSPAVAPLPASEPAEVGAVELPSPTPAPVLTSTATPVPMPPAPTAVPSQEPDPTRTTNDAIDLALVGAIRTGVTPGAVVLVRRGDVTLKREAYGHSYQYSRPGVEADRPVIARRDTIYDLASVSKLYTSVYVMQLVERGLVDLDAPVARYLPAFGQAGKQAVTVRQLMTHTSGLPDFLPLYRMKISPAEALDRIYQTEPQTPPGHTYKYSDLGLIVLGELVQRQSGLTLDQYARVNVLEPLGLQETYYAPPANLRSRIAATQFDTSVNRGLIWGEVHDGNAWLFGGVAGHAGVFATAADLARFGQMIANGGQIDGRRVLRSESVAELLRNQSAGSGRDAHGLVWELNESWYMGQLASGKAVGHTGYTGTSLVVVPDQQLVVVLLTNRVHPSETGPATNGIRRAVADGATRLVPAQGQRTR